MRVLITYGRQQPYSPFGVHLTNAFRSLGHPTVLLCVRDRPWGGTCAKRLPRPWKIWGQWDPGKWAAQHLVKAVEDYRPHVVLELGGNLFHASTLGEIKRRFGARLVIWLSEGPLPDGPTPDVVEYDMVMSTSRVAVEQLQNAGLRSVAYLPFATDLTWFHPWQTPGLRSRYLIGFIGAYSPKRATFLEAVSDLGLNLWGTDWDTKGSSVALRAVLKNRKGVFGRHLVRCYQSAELFINIQREHMTFPAPDGRRVGTGLGWRHFDVPACGSFLLSEWVQELPEAFEIGQEVETFETPEELREKSRYFLSHEGERQAMVRRAQERVLREHTYAHRVRQWLEIYHRLMNQS